MQHGDSDNKPDTLGLKGHQWNTSVYTADSKHHRGSSDSKLSNTLDPTHINSHDFRATSGTTHHRGNRAAAILDRGPSDSSTWSYSTATKTSAERQRSLDRDTHLSKTRSLHNSTQLGPCYISPVQRQKDLTTTMRRGKSSQGLDVKDLTARYGPEGATAMAAILAMPRKLTQRRGHASKEDLAAVAALDMVEVVPETWTHADSLMPEEDPVVLPPEPDHGDPRALHKQPIPEGEEPAEDEGTEVLAGAGLEPEPEDSSGGLGGGSKAGGGGEGEEGGNGVSGTAQ
ncbi:MAG: hypothetical protein WDW36_009181 [Sanguina aurantia]